MPQSDKIYLSLTDDGARKNIYNSTTTPAVSGGGGNSNNGSLLDSVKKVIEHAIVGEKHENELLLSGTRMDQGVRIIGARSQSQLDNNSKRDTGVSSASLRNQSTVSNISIRMPSAHTAEETRLLGAMPGDPMDDIELRSVQLHNPVSRTGSLTAVTDLRRIATDKGDLLIAVQGDTSKPAILTYHDLGLNYATSFAGFFNYPSMRGLLENFCVYHVNAPGQEENAATFPEDFIYPTLDELAAQLLFVLSHFGLKSVIGFGVGAGANILTRFALHQPDKVDALCLINCSSTAAGWIEWGYQLMNARNLRSKGMTQGVLDYLMWHHFGRNPEERNLDLVQVYKSYFERSINPVNLALFIDAYIKRTDMNIARTPSGSPTNTGVTLKMPVLNVTGALSPHIDDTVTFNGRLEPTKTNWMKISDCGLVMEEQPGKLAEAFRLFLQGEGYVCPNNNSQQQHQYAATTIYHRLQQISSSSSTTSTPTTTPTDNNGNSNEAFAATTATFNANTASATTSCNVQQQQQNGNGFRIIENPLPAGACEATRISSMFETY